MKRFALALALVGMVLLAGVAAAAPGPAAPADRPQDGRNSPWVTGDERLERFQERFDLTDVQMAELRAAVAATDGDPVTVRETVRERLEAFGVEDPVLGPPADVGRHTTARGNARGGGNGFGNGGPNGFGPGDGTGPYYDGRGPGFGDCPRG